MTTPAKHAGIFEGVRLKHTDTGSHYADYVWLISDDDGSNCPWFRSECGKYNKACHYVSDFEIIKEVDAGGPTVIGRFEPSEDNDNPAFNVVSLIPIRDSFTGEAGGYQGLKENGDAYHVISRWWDWVPSDTPTPLRALLAPVPVGEIRITCTAPAIDNQHVPPFMVSPMPVYTMLQEKALNTFQSMYDAAELHRAGRISRITGLYGICDNIGRFADANDAPEHEMSMVKENLIRQTLSYSGDYHYPVQGAGGQTAREAFDRNSDKWVGAYGLNRLNQLGEMIELIKSSAWSDDLVHRQSPARRNGIKVGDVVHYTGDDCLWVFRYDDESNSPSFHRMGQPDNYCDLPIDSVKKASAESVGEKSVADFLKALDEKTAKVAEIEKAIQELTKQMGVVKADISMLDYALAEQHKVKRLNQ